MSNSGDISDTIICGYRFSGVEWVSKIMSSLKMLHFSNEEHKNPYDFRCQSAIPLVDTMPSACSSTVFNYHNKMVFVVRNPKDVAVAIYKTMEYGNNMQYFGDFLANFVNGYGCACSWFEHTKEWEATFRGQQQQYVYFLYFDNLVEDFCGELRRLAKFIGVPLNDNTVTKLSTSLSIERAFEQHEPRAKRLRTGLENSEHYHTNNVDLSIYNTGNWKNFFTVSQADKFNSVFTSSMINTQLKISRLM